MTENKKAKGVGRLAIPSAGLSGATLLGSAIVLVLVVSLFPFSAGTLLQSLAAPDSRQRYALAYLFLTVAVVLEIPLFLGLYSAVGSSHSSRALCMTVSGVASSAVNSLSFLLQAGAITGLAASYSTAMDSDTRASIEFQTRNYASLAFGLLSVGILLFALSLVIWSTMLKGGKNSRNYKVITMTLATYSPLAVILAEMVGNIPTFAFFIATSLWLVATGARLSGLRPGFVGSAAKSS